LWLPAAGSLGVERKREMNGSSWRGRRTGDQRRNAGGSWAGSVPLGIAAVIALACLLLPSAASAASGASLGVYVGYADTDRPAPTTFPTPWYEPSNAQIIFDGCHPSSSCEYDGGAVRLVNNSGSTVTIDSVKVEYSSACVYDIWPHNTVLASGKQLIVDQLTSTSTQTAEGCTNTTNPAAPSYGIMDGSDIGPNGANWSANCTQSGVIPQVEVQVNGSTTTFADTGQVLNTGGVDSTFCPPSGAPRNESIQWTPIGSVPCLGAALTLGPSSQTYGRGATATVTAHLVDGCGNPLQGSVASFRVFGANAPDAGQAGSAATDSHGNANFTYADIHSDLGTDDVQASVSDPGGTFFSNVATVVWVNSKFPISVITGLSIHPTSFRAARSGSSVVTRVRRSKFGTVLSYHDSHAALTKFEVLKSLPGRRRGKSCVALPKAHRRGTPCKRFISVGNFIHSDGAGGNRFRFTGRVHGRKLAPGDYLLEVTPHNRGGAGPKRTKTFRII
jgi:hypothetical protein